MIEYMLRPITFSIAKEKLCFTCNEKTKILSDLIPGDLSTYIYNTEEDYYHEYKTSYFAVTQKKAGWDCMRHYEIMANGCIPYFLNIEDCPPNTMFLFPKELMIQGNALYETKFRHKKINELTQTDIAEYYDLQKKVLEYTEEYLTTEKMVSYILQNINCEKAAKILFLSGNTSPDYLRCVTLHGFKTVFGANCHDYPKISHIYKSNALHTDLYGKGMTYSNLLEPSCRNDQLDVSLFEDILHKQYDVVIYGSYHRGMPYYDLVSQCYDANQIVLLCGEDIHHCNHSHFVEKGHCVFVREL
jgi:hypothetical protein